MFRNYIITAARTLWKNRLFSLVNILGLSVGLAIALVIYLFVSAELSYDKFHVHGDQIYRVLRIGNINGEKYLIGVTSPPYATALETDFPSSVTSAVRVMTSDGQVTYQNHSFREENLFLADANFFEFFSFPLAKGDPATVLSTPNSVVISPEIAKKYFGDADPVGKTLRVDNQYDFTVTGVTAPNNLRSHLNFDMVASLAMFADADWYSNWWNNNLYTYVQIATPTAAAQVEAQLGAFIDKYLGDDFANFGSRIDVTLQPLSEVYFQNDVRYDSVLHGDRGAVMIFAAIALFILMIACINYMNLSTARAGRRAREIGVRKTLGANPGTLIVQFLTESFLVALLAMVIAIAAVELLLPVFNTEFALDLQLPLADPHMQLLLGAVLLIVTLAAGSYPALMLSSFRPVRVLKGRSPRLAHTIFLRKGLVVFQFAISVVLIIATLLVGRQLDFLRNKNLGFNDKQVVLVRLDNSEIRQNRFQFKDRLRSEPGVRAVSLMSGEPGGFHDTMSHEVTGLDEKPRLRTVFSDVDYTKTLDIPIVAGRDFSESFGADGQQSVLLNETAVRKLGWSNEEAVGKRFKNVYTDSSYREVVGVLKDYHFASLKTPIEPLIVSCRDRGWAGTIAVKIDAGNAREAIAAMEKQWNAISPEYPFNYTFLDDSFFRLYRQEQQESRLFSVFTIIAIFIACLGIYALASFAADERTREIGIRKVLGATVPNLIQMLSQEFLLLVSIAGLIAAPLAWFAMRRWLENFAYHIPMEWWIYALAIGLALFVALATVIFQAIKASLANPVKSLRYE